MKDEKERRKNGDVRAKGGNRKNSSFIPHPSSFRAGPQAIGDILPELMARRGYARVQAAQEYESAWREAVGPLAAQYTRVGGLRGGKLEVVTANSTLIQELTFQKAAILATLNRLLPEQGFKDLRFRLGAIS